MGCFNVTLFIFITLLLLGVLVGFINLVSAGGSLITLPTLIFLGLPPTVANGTNRIGILIQNFLGMYQFYKKELINWKLNFILYITSFIVFINLVSAGGSLITLPTLIFLGLPPTVANGTNRIGILIQNFLGMYQFYKKGLINWKLNFILAIPAVIGSIIGAQYAIELSDDAFNNVLAIVMIVLLILIFLKPQKYLKIDNSSWLVKNKMIILSIVFIFIGFYGG